MFTSKRYLFHRDNTSASCLVADKRKDESEERPFTSFDLSSSDVGAPLLSFRDGLYLASSNLAGPVRASCWRSWCGECHVCPGCRLHQPT